MDIWRDVPKSLAKAVQDIGRLCRCPDLKGTNAWPLDPGLQRCWGELARFGAHGLCSHRPRLLHSPLRILPAIPAHPTTFHPAKILPWQYLCFPQMIGDTFAFSFEYDAKTARMHSRPLPSCMRGPSRYRSHPECSRASDNLCCWPQCHPMVYETVPHKLLITVIT